METTATNLLDPPGISMPVDNRQSLQGFTNVQVNALNPVSQLALIQLLRERRSSYSSSLG